MSHAPSLNIEDLRSLTEYLAGTRGLPRDAFLSCETLAGGVSCRTVRVNLRNGESWVLKQSLPKLRVAVDWFSDPKRIHREALALRTLGQFMPPGSVPGFVFEDRDQHVLAMQAVPLPHDNFKTLLLAGMVCEDHVVQFGEWLGKLQRLSHERRDELAPQFADREFFETLRIEPYYLYAAQQAPAAKEFLSDLVNDTRARQLTLVHGDYSPKNVLVCSGRIVLLDFEVMHWGDPAFDVGFALAHFLSKARHLSEHRQRFLAAADTFWLACRRELASVPFARDLEPRCVRHALACLLARAVGRSPLEYLSAEERQQQRDAVLALLASPPESLSGLASLVSRGAGA